MKPITHYRHKGFTLMELVIVCVILFCIAGLLFTGLKVALKVIGVLALVCVVGYFVWNSMNKKPPGD